MGGTVGQNTQRRALLLTDLVDSTRLAEALGDRGVALLWARHDRVARDLLAAHRGREIDKTDGFLLLFERVVDAVAYAMDYHRSIAALAPPLKARAGVHVGSVVLTENRPEDVLLGAKPIEVDGIAKPTAARLMALAVGGQTLLTAEARLELGPTALRVLSHGHWRVKGVTDPVEVYEVGEHGAPFTPPPDGAKVHRVIERDHGWVPVAEVPHALPAERDPFVGRRADLVELARLLDDGARLVSVVGMGGAGKTRLVTRFAWSWLGEWPGGAWFCDLSDASSEDGVVFAVARALDVPLGPQDHVAQLGHAIAARGRCLVVLDNFEQVVRHATSTLGRWLDRASQATFVVTTREVLGLPGERAFTLASLPTEEAVELFVVRAAAAQRDFVLTDPERSHVVALVGLLDGLPLAIELAAARVRLMPPRDLLARMGDRFKLLTSSGARRDRQATLRAALDWSWDLLTPHEQAALAQLSVFEGGFTLEATAAVLDLPDDAPWGVDLLQSLVDKSLVRRVDASRFDLLVTVQAYAAEKLAAGAARDAAHARHGRFFERHGTSDALRALHQPGGALRRRLLELELENLVAASRRSVARAEGPVAAATARAAWAVLARRGPLARGRTTLVEALTLDGHSPKAAAGLACAAAHATAAVGRPDEARALFERAIAASWAADDRAGVCQAVLGVGNLLRETGRTDEARSTLEQALALSREVDDPASLGSVLNGLGNLCFVLGREDQALANWEQALAIARQLGDLDGEGSVCTNLGAWYGGRGQVEEARGHLDRALELAREVADRQGEGAVLAALGLLSRRQGRMDEGRACYEQALRLHREMGQRRSEFTVLSNLGVLHVEQGRLDEAQVHYEQALAVACEVGSLAGEGNVAGNLGLLAAQRGRLDEARSWYTRALDAGRAAGDPRLVGGVNHLLADIHRRQGRADEARACLDRALVVFREIGDRRQEGVVLGSLGTWHLEHGRPDAARASFEEGEHLLRASAARLDLGKLLCGRAELDHAVGSAEAAARAFDEAHEIAVEFGAGPASELGLALAALELLRGSTGSSAP